MSAILLGIPGKLNALSTRLSAVWSAKLDTLSHDLDTTRISRVDAVVSSIAPAVTALSTAVWSNTLAASLDAGVSAIKTIQRGLTYMPSSGATFVVATLATAVTYSKAVCIFNGVRIEGSTDDSGATKYAAQLTSGTEVTCYRLAAWGMAGYCAWTVVEFI